ncbi:hypothetical protein H0H87_000338, partial [Tephrocybe sp. NHM501043]
RRRDRRPITSAGKRTLAHRRVRPRVPAQTAASPNRFPAPQPEFSFDREPTIEPMEVEDQVQPFPITEKTRSWKLINRLQMDWIGDKLSMLIEEGKRALSREIVVTSDAKEDEVDDGSGAWEEDDVPRPYSASSSRAGSLRRSTKRPRSLAPSPHTFSHTHHPSLSPSPTKSAFAFAPSSAPQMTSTPPHRGIGLGMPYEITPSTSFREDERAWESPEIRESMERARARLLPNRGS